MHFRIRDVQIPDPAELLKALHGDKLVQGRVIVLSSSGEPGGSFAVVQVPEVDRPIVVATERVTLSP